MAANANTNLSNPRISVSFLRTYPSLNKIDDKTLQEGVDSLKEEWIMTKNDLENFSKDELKGTIPLTLLKALYPEEGKPLSCS